MPITSHNSPKARGPMTTHRTVSTALGPALITREDDSWRLGLVNLFTWVIWAPTGLGSLSCKIGRMAITLAASQGCEGWIWEPKADRTAPAPGTTVSLCAANRFSASWWWSHCPWEQHCPRGGRSQCLNWKSPGTILKSCCQTAAIRTLAWWSTGGLRLHAFSLGGAGSIPGKGTKILYAAHHNHKVKILKRVVNFKSSCPWH